MALAGQFGPLEGFDQDTRRVLESAAVEAERLGHQRIGTEHLLLGLLSNDDTPEARALRHVGVSLAATRSKVAEAVGMTGDAAPAREAMPATKRATRAVEGAARLSHQRRREAVTSSDLLLAVLNVEGTAGQVLRGLGIDIDQLRELVDQASREPAAPANEDPAEPALHCPSCGNEIGTSLRHHVVAARSDVAARRDASVFSCGSCGVVLGVSTA